MHKEDAVLLRYFLYFLVIISVFLFLISSQPLLPISSSSTWSPSSLPLTNSTANLHWSVNLLSDCVELANGSDDGDHVDDDDIGRSGCDEIEEKEDGDDHQKIEEIAKKYRIFFMHVRVLQNTIVRWLKWDLNYSEKQESSMLPFLKSRCDAPRNNARKAKTWEFSKFSLVCSCEAKTGEFSKFKCVRARLKIQSWLN